MAVLCRQQTGEARAPALKRTDLAIALARREAKRIGELAAAYQVHLAVHLAACVTLAHDAERRTFQSFAAQEKATAQRSNGGDAAVLTDLLQQALPLTSGIAPVLPDLIGEAFLLVSGMGTDAPLRCYARWRVAVARTVIRCAQDFSPQQPEPLDCFVRAA